MRFVDTFDIDIDRFLPNCSSLVLKYFLDLADEKFYQVYLRDNFV